MTAPTDFTRLREWCARNLWTTPRGTPVRGDDPDDPMPFHDVPRALAALDEAVAVLGAHDEASCGLQDVSVLPNARCDCCGALRDPCGPGAILPRCASCGALKMPFELFGRDCVDCLPEGATEAALASVAASWKAHNRIAEVRAAAIERVALSVPCASCGHDRRAHMRWSAPASTYCSWTPPEAEPPTPDDFCKCRAFVAPKETTP